MQECRNRNVDWQGIYALYEFAGRTHILNWATVYTSGMEQARARVLLQEHLTSMGQKALERGRLLEARDYFRFAREQAPSSIALKWDLRRLRGKLWKRRTIVLLLWCFAVWYGLYFLSMLR